MIVEPEWRSAGSVYLWSDLKGRQAAGERDLRGRMNVMLLHEDRLFPSESNALKVARSLYASIRNLPIVSPHGHTQAAWFAKNEPFPDPATLFVQPDHYVFRMLYSQGVSMDDLEIGQPVVKDPRRVWRIFASHYYLFRGTPTRMWLDYAFQELFGMKERLSEKTADLYFDTIAEKLKTPEFLPRALYEKFNIEVLSTTESPLDPLKAHQAIRDSGWKARIVPAFRPDAVVDPAFAGFAGLVAKLGEQNGEDSSTWKGYLNALMKARARFKALGCTSTDHGHPTAQTADLAQTEAAALFGKVIAGKADAAEQELFRAQMLTEMARMSVEDGLVMQIHPGQRAQPQQVCVTSVTGATWAPTFPGRPTTCMRCGRCWTALATRRI